MGSERNDQIAESFITFDEAVAILEVKESELESLISGRKLSAFKIAEGVLRFKRDEVFKLKSQIRIASDLFPDKRSQKPEQSLKISGTFFDHVRDFFYFNDFYILSVIVVGLLFYLILSSQ